MYYTYQDTPMGTILLTREDGVLTGLYWKVFKRIPKLGETWREDESVFEDVLSQLEEYYRGERQAFDINFHASGTPFQLSVWKELEKIPYGQSISYQAIAAAVGKPKAVRAVGTAIGSNPLSIIVPCHRVLTSDGKLGGYAGGLAAKLALLQTEGIRQ